MPSPITLTLNGERKTLNTDPARTLLEVLREDLHLTGTKYGCGEGACGACTVLVDGKPTRSCVTPASAVEGKAVTTIEGLSAGGDLHPAQQAYLAESAFQCGYCTPGMIMATAALLERNRTPTDHDIQSALGAHICRCCSYPSIVAAVLRAAGTAGRETK